MSDLVVNALLDIVVGFIGAAGDGVESLETE